MPSFTAAEAKNRFGELVDTARIEPVAVTKYDKPFVIVLGVDEYEKLTQQKDQKDKLDNSVEIEK
jgi:prevent-host-death family protein